MGLKKVFFSFRSQNLEHVEFSLSGRMTCFQSFLLLLIAFGSASAFLINVTVHNSPLRKRQAISPASTGCHFSPLNHQLFSVYSQVLRHMIREIPTRTYLSCTLLSPPQMVYDESFEQFLGGELKTENVSLGWCNTTNNVSVGAARWINSPALALNG